MVKNANALIWLQLCVFRVFGRMLAWLTFMLQIKLILQVKLYIISYMDDNFTVVYDKYMSQAVCRDLPFRNWRLKEVGGGGGGGGEFNSNYLCVTFVLFASLRQVWGPLQQIWLFHFGPWLLWHSEEGQVISKFSLFFHCTSLMSWRSPLDEIKLL